MAVPTLILIQVYLQILSSKTKSPVKSNVFVWEVETARWVWAASCACPSAYPHVCLHLRTAPACTYPLCLSVPASACQLYLPVPTLCACLYMSVSVWVSLYLSVCTYICPVPASCACSLHSLPILLLLANSRSLKFPTQAGRV